MTTMTTTTTDNMNREAWLIDAARIIKQDIFAPLGYDVPTIRLSVGFPGGGSKRNRIGECWAKSAASDNINNIFISPIVADSHDVLATLVHEMVHAIDDCQNGHRAPFASIAKVVGLEGKMTATVAGEDLKVRLSQIITDLGEIPNGHLTVPSKVKGRGAYATYRCPDTGYTARITWATERDFGGPICPCCNMSMVSSD